MRIRNDFLERLNSHVIISLCFEWKNKGFNDIKFCDEPKSSTMDWRLYFQVLLSFVRFELFNQEVIFATRWLQIYALFTTISTKQMAWNWSSHFALIYAEINDKTELADSRPNIWPASIRSWQNFGEINSWSAYIHWIFWHLRKQKHLPIDFT